MMGSFGERLRDNDERERERGRRSFWNKEKNVEVKNIILMI
jgi:hypothetical protein